MDHYIDLPSINRDSEKNVEMFCIILIILIFKLSISECDEQNAILIEFAKQEKIYNMSYSCYIFVYLIAVKRGTIAVKLFDSFNTILYDSSADLRQCFP